MSIGRGICIHSLERSMTTKLLKFLTSAHYWDYQFSNPCSYIHIWLYNDSLKKDKRNAGDHCKPCVVYSSPVHQWSFFWYIFHELNEGQLTLSEKKHLVTKKKIMAILPKRQGWTFIVDQSWLVKLLYIKWQNCGKQSARSHLYSRMKECSSRNNELYHFHS